VTSRIAGVPARDQWPEPPTHSEEGKVLTQLVLTVFRLNGRLLEAAGGLAAAGEITAAWWQVLGGVAPDQPRTVAEIGRVMGMSRQAVQRIADILVARGLAEYRPNPHHRRAKLVARTEAGNYALRRISLVQHPWTDRLGRELGTQRIAEAVGVLEQLAELIDREAEAGSPPLT
jgi:DNA-binding MarR family transcriptional regulator